MEILSLNNFSKYNELVQYYEENKHRTMKDWLTFETILDKPGKQGIVGIFRTENGDKLIFKISQYINYLVYHELIIMQGLKEISTYCPHFCKGIGMITSNVDAKYKKNVENPFEITNKYPIEKDILLCEYIDNSCKFYNYIRSPKIDEDVLYSIVKQVLLAISIAQKEKQFTHYDLHSFNVMIKKCDKDLVFLYKIDEDNQFCVPTLGYFPVIIDFGFSYISDMIDGPLWPSLAHTDVGFMSDRFDWVADPKLFLVTVSDEIKNKRKTKKSKSFRRVVRNIFSNLSIDWESGWDEFKNNKGASDYILEKLEKHNNISDLFKTYDYYCIDLIQTLVIIPLEKQNYENIIETYRVFLKEWIKIENEISNPFYNLYILKSVIDVTRSIRPEYVNKTTRQNALKIFRQYIYDSIAKVSKFCIPKDIHFEKMLCSLLVLAKNIEGFLFEVMNSKMERKQKQYDRMPLKSIEQIYAAISINIKDDYVYNENTKVLIMDNTNKECNIFNIPEDEIENLNNITHLATGTYIYDLYKSYIS